MPLAVELNLPRDINAPAAARRALTRHFDDLLEPARLADLHLVITELVSNALVHGHGEIVVRLQLTGHTVRGEVIDQGAGFEQKLRVSGPDDVNGRGLMLVEQLANRWGVHEGTTHVWFELATDAPPSSDAHPPALGEAARPSELDRADDPAV